MRFTSALLLVVGAFTFMVHASPIEIVGREALAIPETSPAINGDEALKPRQATYSLVACNQRNFRGTCETITADINTCLVFTSDLVQNHLLSGYAVGVPGLYLYHDGACVQDVDRLWIDQAGWRDLYAFAAFGSMNMDG